MRAFAVLAALALAGCGTDTAESFQLLVDDQPIELVAPTTVIVQVIVVGAASDQVTITSPNLPGFATISGQSVELSPTYDDTGDYAIDLVATSAGETAHATLRLHVTQMNTGPMWLPVPFFTGGSSSTEPYAQMRAPVCDKQHDNFRFEISVAPIGQAIPNTPDFTHDVDFSVTQPIIDPEAGWCADFITLMPGLAPGDYHGAVHAVDVHGLEDPYGWVELGGTFTVTP